MVIDITSFDLADIVNILGNVTKKRISCEFLYVSLKLLILLNLVDKNEVTSLEIFILIYIE